MSLDLFKQRLHKNYDNPTDRQIFVDVGNFLKHYPTPGEYPEDDALDALFIKQITKIASYMGEKDICDKFGIHYDLPLMTAASNYCLEGIRLIESKYSQKEEFQISEPNLQKMLCHLYTHLSEFEEELAKSEILPDKKKVLLESAFNHFSQGAKISIDSLHIAYGYSSQREVARDIADICEGAEKEKWIRQEVKCAMFGARLISEKENSRHKGFQFTFAADSLFRYAIESKDMNIELKIIRLERSIKCACKGARLLKNCEPNHSAITYANAGKYASELFNLTGNSEYKELARELLIRSNRKIALIPKTHSLTAAINSKIRELSDKNNNGKPYQSIDSQRRKDRREKSKINKLTDLELDNF